MKIKIIFAIIILFVMNSFTLKMISIHNVLVKNDLEKLELKGKVKNLTEITIVGNVFGLEHVKGDTLYKYIYSFDEKGRLVSRLTFDRNIDKNALTKYVYNEKGTLDTVLVYTLGNRFVRKSILFHDSVGNNIEEKTYGPKGDLIDKSLYKYDVKGNVIEWKSYFMGYNTGGYKFKYNEKGQKILKISFGGGNSLKDTLWYNEMGYLEGEQSFTTSNDDHLYLYQYSYDSERNWIKRIQFEKGIVKYIVERQISYY